MDSLVPEQIWKCFCSNAEGAGKNLEESFLIKIFYAKHTDSGNRGNRFIAYKIVAVVYASA